MQLVGRLITDLVTVGAQYVAILLMVAVAATIIAVINYGFGMWAMRGLGKSVVELRESRAPVVLAVVAGFVLFCFDAGIALCIAYGLGLLPRYYGWTVGLAALFTAAFSAYFFIESARQYRVANS